MMAKQRDQKCCRTIANDLVILLRGWIAFLFNQHINFGAQMSPITLKLLLTSMTVVTVASKEVSGGLQCYIDVEAKTIVTCNELEGFKTCFVKYNDSKYIPSAFPFGVLHQYQEAAVVGRGCSTKDKVFYKECETHSYGDSLEKMCFCSFQLCNRSAIQLNCPSLWTLTLLTLSTVLASWTFPGWIWDPWPPFAHLIQPLTVQQQHQKQQPQRPQPQRPAQRPDDRPPQLLQIDIITNSDTYNTSTENKPPLSESTNKQPTLSEKG